MKYDVKGVELNFNEMYDIYEFMKQYFLMEDINQGIDDMIEDNPKEYGLLIDNDEGSVNEAREIVIKNILNDYNQEMNFNGSRDYQFLLSCIDAEVRDAVVGDEDD